MAAGNDLATDRKLFIFNHIPAADGKRQMVRSIYLLPDGKDGSCCLKDLTAIRQTDYTRFRAGAVRQIRFITAGCQGSRLKGLSNGQGKDNFLFDLPFGGVISCHFASLQNRGNR